MINKQEVKKIAKLARLELTDKEVEKMEGELSKVLDYIDKLKEVDIEEIGQKDRFLNLENVFREDEVKNDLMMKNEELLSLSPEEEQGYLKVKSVLR
jgi:aspartyl-tRNA(Asn)/glutamyl-tRNA(Gln) amidotransferase subunit C